MKSGEKRYQDQDEAQDSEANIELLDQEGKPRTSKSSDGSDNDEDDLHMPTPSIPPKRGLAFWTTIIGLIFTLMLSGLEANITATALPTIVHELGQSNQFVWILHSFTLSSTIIQPPIGQLADVFGRKTPMMLSVLSFTLGSLISGISTNLTTMVIGRILQGCGSGGTFVLADLIVSDIIPLRERPTFMGILMTGSSVAYAAGPSIGGMMTQYLSWRWAYLINVPIGALAIVVLGFALRLKPHKSKTLSEAIQQIDILGTLTLSLSTVAMMLALSADSGFWTSTPLLISFILGLAGTLLFALLQTSPRLSPHPIMPARLFNLPSTLAFALAFLSNGIMMLVPYFLPVYFQAVLLASPARAGVYLLATVLTLLPAAMLVGAAVTKAGHVRSAHVASFALIALSAAGYMLADHTTTAATWVPLSILGAVGIGGMIPTALPAAQAPLPDTDVAAVTATFAFFRSLGFLWGFALPSFVFKERVEALVGATVADRGVAASLRSGGAFANASARFVRGLVEPTRGQVVRLYTQALSAVWKVTFAAALVGVVVAVVQPPIKLRETLEAGEFGLEEGGKARDPEE